MCRTFMIPWDRYGASVTLRDLRVCLAILKEEDDKLAEAERKIEAQRDAHSGAVRRERVC